MHQTFFSMPPATLIKAINNHQLDGIPFMKAELIRKHLPTAPATSKGHMKRPRAGICSTRKAHHRRDLASPTLIKINNIHQNAIRTNPHLIPDDEPLDGMNNVFCFAALADTNKRTLYTNATGLLPARSLHGNQYYFIAYDYDLNCIFAVSIPNLLETRIIETLQHMFNQLKGKGFKPKFNVTDNQAAVKI